MRLPESQDHLAGRRRFGLIAASTRPINSIRFRRLIALLWVASASLPDDGRAQTNETGSFVWRDARELTVEGKGWQDTKEFYDRLPARAEAVVRPAVWGLSRNSAGLGVRFVSDATTIAARWTLRNASLAMPHMPATGVSGLDLYVKDDSGWHWLANGRPLQQKEEKTLVNGLAPGRREYLLYLPLYNGVEEVKIGVPSGAALVPAPARIKKQKPIVFYGTSILQGGCAARPGMAYPAILGRKLDWPTINLGFSGNAHSEPEVATLLAELDPAVYVLDPLPNMSAEMVAERIEPFVLTLRRAHPRTSILLVEHPVYPAQQFFAGRQERINAANDRLREVFRNLQRQGVKRLFLFHSGAMLGRDDEATVDGTHPTDVGFERIATAMLPTLKRLLR